MDARPDRIPAPTALADRVARLWHAGRLHEAALLLAETVAGSPDPAPLLLWQGHALRAAGDPAGALMAYRRAAAEAPADPEPHRHRGHALRVGGQVTEAMASYALAVALDIGALAGSAAAERAVRALAEEDPVAPEPPAPPAEIPQPTPVPAPAPLPPEAPSPAPPPVRPPARLAPPPRPRMAVLRARDEAPRPGEDRPEGALAFDVTDLLLHFGHRRTVTGIQRVQAGLVGAALASGRDAAYLAYDPGRLAWRAVPPAALSRLIAAAAAGADTEDPAWSAARDAAERALAGAPPHVFPPDAVLVNFGNSWGVPDYFRGLRAAQRAVGLRYVPFLHDCVPLVMPEHCVRTLVHDYVRWFSAVGVHAHGILCNSEATRADGRRFLDALLPGLDLPTAVVRLDADPRPRAAPDPAALEGTRAPRPPEPYVLFVATIESRKDHLTVFRAWLDLLRRHGPARVPRLVLVGSEGWHAEAATNLLAGSPELARHVVPLHGVSDGALAALYRDCLFTLYNSHHEGWGLPVTESLAWGKVPVVPRHSALLESGEGAAVYVDPQSVPDMVAAIERLTLRPEALAEAGRAVAALPARRGWDAVLEEAVAAIRAFGVAAAPGADRLLLPLGQHLPVRRLNGTTPHLGAALADAVREGTGWSALEEWGSALAGGPARLRLPLPPGAAGPLRLHLEMRAAGGGALDLALSADSVPAGGARVHDLPAGDFATAVTIEVAEGTRVLELDLEGPAGTGLRGLMLCREDDLLARLGFLEGQRLPPVVPD